MDLKMTDLNNPQELEAVIKKIDCELKGAVGQKRYDHSVRTAETAEKMCALYNLNPRIGYLAGIAHDLCKEMPKDEMKALAVKDLNPVTELEDKNPGLFHGRAAAVLIKSKYGIDDKDVLEAIANHTFAAENLCDLGKILFAADKIEPGRPQSTDEYRADLFSKPLDYLTLSVLQENIEYLEVRGKSVAEASYKLRDQLLTMTGGNK